jgi:IS30 family transposase
MSNEIKHLSFDDRLEIEKGLRENKSFKQIGKDINKHCTTVSKEVRNHYKILNTGAVGRVFFDCYFRKNCQFKEPGKKCNVNLCEHYKQELCSNLDKPPYVCNGCSKKSTCTLTTHIYDSIYSHKEYLEVLKESKQGTVLNQDELKHLSNILKPLIADQGQSIHSACINNVNSIMISERNIYNLIDKGYLDVKNIDLPRKVRYKTRKKKNTYYKIDKQCLDGRKYSNYLDYIKENPDISVVEMDTVEGIKGGKAILTLHFVNCGFMLAFIREHNDAQSIIDIFDYLESILGLVKFRELFQLILTDNGSEFSNPKALEFNSKGEQRTKIFYCEPNRPDQKSHCENNHEFIRRILPKKTSFNDLTQEDFNKVMSHINSYKRKKLNDCSPLQLFSLMYGNEVATKLGIIEIKPNEINLKPDLLK